MRDVFYTLLVVWIIWRILNAISIHKSGQTNTTQPNQRKEGETTVDFVPPSKKKISDDEGEYVDFEEMK
jgi:hypothetical protein